MDGSRRGQFLTKMSVDELRNAYQQWTRRFVDCELDHCSLVAIDVSGALFEKCFLSCDFQRANCERIQFMDYNLKAADFSQANLKAASIKGCPVDGVTFKGANVESCVFEENYFQGIVLRQNDISLFC